MNEAPFMWEIANLESQIPILESSINKSSGLNGKAGYTEHTIRTRYKESEHPYAIITSQFDVRLR